jgi:hypothetical protein
VIAPVALALTVLLAAPGDAAVGITPGAVEVAEPIAPATDQVVGEVTVRNPGPQRTAYEMYAQEGPDGLAISDTWFLFEPSTFELEPGATQVVAVRLRPDENANPGRYTALLTAAIVTSSDAPAAAQVSGAVATEASFVIDAAEPSTGVVSSSAGSSDGGGGGIPVWAWGIAALVVAIAVLGVSSGLREARDTDRSGQRAAG